MNLHPGFKAVQAKIAAKQGVSPTRAGAILAAGTRRAGPKARKANPRLNRVKGATFDKGGMVGEESAKHERGESKRQEREENRPDKKGQKDRPEFKGDKRDKFVPGRTKF